MKKLVALLVFCFCFGSMAMANGLEGNVTLTEHTIKHKGIEYSYYLYTPKNLPKGAPLVIFFHGYGANNVPATGFGFNPIADKNGFAICYPRGPKDFRDMPCWAVGYSFHTEKGWERDPDNKDGWGEYIAVPRAVSYWAAVNRCTHEICEELPLINNKVIAHRYVDGINGNQVWLYEVVGGTHSWADKDMNPAAEIWKFFSLYLK